MGNKFEKLIDRISSIDSDNSKLTESKKKLNEEVNMLNTKLLELGKAFKYLKKYSDYKKEIITRDSYELELLKIEENYQEAEGEKREHYISESINLNNQRWQSIHEFRSKWNNDRIELRHELEKNLLKLSLISNYSQQQLESLFLELDEIINQEEKLILSEINLTEEQILINKKLSKLVERMENLLLE